MIIYIYIYIPRLLLAENLYFWTTSLVIDNIPREFTQSQF